MSDSLPRWMRRIPTTSGDVPEAVPAATVVLLRDAPGGVVETLMVRRSSKLEFAGGMWVFPGGRVDPDDIPTDGDVIEAARHAAVREALEEADLVVDADALVPFSHWVPPPVTAKRFATWFFLGPAPAGAVTVDMGEIRDHRWLQPADAIARRDAEEIELAPPTWVTLHTLRAQATVDAAIAAARLTEPEHFTTKAAFTDEGVVVMWHGDAGYEDGDPTRAGGRHRLWMVDTGWRYERNSFG
jgi:8-oxo-dGTP pyrophosphatase MutT (NUDIX family)